MSEWCVCPSCSHRIHIGQLFCEGCGRRVLYSPMQRARLRMMELQRVKQKQRTERNGGVYMLCLHCGAHNPKGAYSCGTCGTLGLVGPLITD